VEPGTDADHLRALIANERRDRLALVAPIVVAVFAHISDDDVEDSRGPRLRVTRG
jgi:hypothetical protein